jgi:hypothetical protein
MQPLKIDSPAQIAPAPATLDSANLRGHLVAVALAALGIGLLFLREPGFGDDLTYWSFAFDLHEQGLSAWQKQSFHDLRWPVWIWCWIFQGIFGFGVAAYYGVPLLYLGGGATVAFTFGQRLLGSIAAGWACAIAFIFHPLLDSVSYRPMPDLSEGVLGGAVLLVWWSAMQAKTRGRSIGWAALTGWLIYVLESNRVTGVFIVPVLIVATLLFFPWRFDWLVVAGAFSALCYGAECAFYKWLFNDWLHHLHATLGATGAKGTDTVPVWFIPLRFFDTLWNGNPLAPAYCILALGGIFVAWRKGGTTGRLMVVWFATLLLEYSCAPQSLWPWRPLIRDADRFLCGLAVPMAVLAATGLTAFWRKVIAPRAGRAWWQHPITLGLGGIVLCAAITTRERYNPGFVREMRNYMAALPDGTKVFSHDAMRAIAHLAGSQEARRFQWFATGSILHRTAKLEKAAAESDEFWYARKLVWLTTRKQLEKKKFAEQPTLGSYLEAPEQDWQLARLLAKGDTPDLIFYRRRTAETPPVQILEAGAAEFAGLIPALPLTWDGGTGKTVAVHWTVPENLRAKYVSIQLAAASDAVEALTVRLRFSTGGRPTAEYLLKPYLYPGGGKEFFSIPIDADAERCEVQFKLAKNADEVHFTGFRALVEQPVP